MTHDPYALTILTASPDHRAAKRHTQTQDGGWSTEDYNCGWRFTLDTAPVPTLRDLSDTLAQLQDDPRAFVVRGARIDGYTSHADTRRHHESGVCYHHDSGMCMNLS